ncbi:uncharacterized protein B0H18DRAFT_1118636 [Fomitopsis serialis]|uniref:uncharacterized protein n=1 Tax=Fomitopsis serialis TaxID=139415 RepID=UPI00200785A6|nr:uncharacterized protein B0H18DRAFT_1118636 [Neoantrodia serialis]KAH9926874.1 hypothetical protein B0H18DRAFT_1118636 [Neoantrodia serialis]
MSMKAQDFVRVKLSKEFNLATESDPNDVDHECAAAEFIAQKTGWPYLKECWVGESTELVFGVYIDYRNRAHPPKRIERSRSPPIELADRLDDWMPLMCQCHVKWFRYVDASYSPLGRGEILDADGDEEDDAYSDDGVEYGDDEGYDDESVGWDGGMSNTWR